MSADRAQANQGLGEVPKPRTGRGTQTKDWERYPNQGLGEVPKPRTGRGTQTKDWERYPNQGLGEVPKPRTGRGTQTKDWERYPNRFRRLIETLFPKYVGKHCREWPAGKTVRDQVSRSRKQQTATPYSVH